MVIHKADDCSTEAIVEPDLFEPLQGLLEEGGFGMLGYIMPEPVVLEGLTCSKPLLRVLIHQGSDELTSLDG
jgi:hypothetical protein